MPSQSKSVDAHHGGGPSRAPAPTASTADGVPTRVIELAPGQQLQATVVELGDRGAVTIGVLGTKLAAFSKLPLQVGVSYEFTVRTVQPRLVLVAAAPSGVAGGIGEAASVIAARVASGLGISGSVLSALLPAPGEAVPASNAAATETPDAESTRRADGEVATEWLRSADVVSAGQDLSRLHRTLGHDLEGRVLRAARSALAGRAGHSADAPAVLRETLKARALAWLADSTKSAQGDDVRRKAAALVEGLSGIERENVRRSDQGAPLWMPLPADPERGVLDARMFLFLASDREAQDDTHSREADSAALTIVLLLDLTRLGALRVDLGVNGNELTIDVETVEVESLRTIRLASTELRQALESHGLSVQRLEVRQAPGRRLTVNDLLVLPATSDLSPSDRVDVHA